MGIREGSSRIKLLGLWIIVIGTGAGLLIAITQFNAGQAALGIMVGACIGFLGLIVWLIGWIMQGFGQRQV